MTAQNTRTVTVGNVKIELEPGQSLTDLLKLVKKDLKAAGKTKADAQMVVDGLRKEIQDVTYDLEWTISKRKDANRAKNEAKGAGLTELYAQELNAWREARDSAKELTEKYEQLKAKLPTAEAELEVAEKAYNELKSDKALVETAIRNEQMKGARKASGSKTKKPRRRRSRKPQDDGPREWAPGVPVITGNEQTDRKLAAAPPKLQTTEEVVEDEGGAVIEFDASRVGPAVVVLPDGTTAERRFRGLSDVELTMKLAEFSSKRDNAESIVAGAERKVEQAKAELAEDPTDADLKRKLKGAEGGVRGQTKALTRIRNELAELEAEAQIRAEAARQAELPPEPEVSVEVPEESELPPEPEVAVEVPEEPEKDDSFEARLSKAEAELATARTAFETLIERLGLYDAHEALKAAESELAGIRADFAVEPAEESKVA